MILIFDLDQNISDLLQVWLTHRYRQSEEPKSKRRALCLVRMAGWRVTVTANTSKSEEAKRISCPRPDEINMLGRGK